MDDSPLYAIMFIESSFYNNNIGIYGNLSNMKVELFFWE